MSDTTQDEAAARAAEAQKEAAAKAAEGRASMHAREQQRREDEFQQNEKRIAAEGEKAAGRAGAEQTLYEATVPHFVQLHEPSHSAEFILSEANGQRSREAAYFADPVDIYVGMPCSQSAPATATLPATYVPATSGADCLALCIYAGGSIPGEGLRTAVIARDAEVNKNLISWGAITGAEIDAGIAALATVGILAR